MFKDLGERVEGAVLEGIGKASSRVQENKPLRADLLESDEAFLAVFDAPGVTSEDVEVRFDADTVRVRLDRFRDYHEGFDMRIPGRGLSLYGSVDLPADASVDAREADATLTRNGTLRVRIPKTDPEGGSVDVAEEPSGESGDVARSGSGVGAEADVGLDDEDHGDEGGSGGGVGGEIDIDGADDGGDGRGD